MPAGFMGLNFDGESAMSEPCVGYRFDHLRVGRLGRQSKVDVMDQSQYSDANTSKWPSIIDYKTDEAPESIGREEGVHPKDTSARNNNNNNSSVKCLTTRLNRLISSSASMQKQKYLVYLATERKTEAYPMARARAGGLIAHKSIDQCNSSFKTRPIRALGGRASPVSRLAVLSQ